VCKSGGTASWKQSGKIQLIHMMKLTAPAAAPCGFVRQFVACAVAITELSRVADAMEVPYFARGSKRMTAKFRQCCLRCDALIGKVRCGHVRQSR
jgi:hypothetical protein